jgi:hypothetical protein
MVLTVRERGARAARPVAIALSNDALKCFCMLISWTTGEPPNTGDLRIFNRRWTLMNTDKSQEIPLHPRPSASICGSLLFSSCLSGRYWAARPVAIALRSSAFACSFPGPRASRPCPSLRSLHLSIGNTLVSLRDQDEQGIELARVTTRNKVER